MCYLRKALFGRLVFVVLGLLLGVLLVQDRDELVPHCGVRDLFHGDVLDHHVVGLDLGEDLGFGFGLHVDFYRRIL